MASKNLLDLLNKAIARELQVSIQYMWHYVLWKGVKGFAVKDELKRIAIREMSHAEDIAERLNYLGGVPTTQPEQIYVGEGLRDMIENDMKAEEAAISLYKEINEVATREGDVVTAKIFRDILVEEEDHHDTFRTLLEEI